MCWLTKPVWCSMWRGWGGWGLPPDVRYAGWQRPKHVRFPSVWLMHIWFPTKLLDCDRTVQSFVFFERMVITTRHNQRISITRTVLWLHSYICRNKVKSMAPKVTVIFFLVGPQAWFSCFSDQNFMQTYVWMFYQQCFTRCTPLPVVWQTQSPHSRLGQRRSPQSCVLHSF